jgi:negative regulator of flagellin synthesis FlgM
MIKGLGDKQLGGIGASRVGFERAAPTAKVAGGPDEARAAGPVSTAAELAAKGPPIDADKVAALKAAIAEGRYPIEPARIAEGMIAFDGSALT